MDFPRGIRSHGAGLQIRFQYKGQQYTENIETNTPNNKRTIASAILRKEEMLNRLKLGLPLNINQEGQAVLLSTVAHAYVESLDVERSTAISYVRILNQHWLPSFGHWPLTDLRPSHIKSYLASTNLSSKTKRNMLVPLRCVYNHAMGDGVIEANPVSAVKVKKHQKPPIERFTPEERDRILAKLKGDNYVYFMIMFETGMRPSEILALEWADYDGTKFHVSKSVVWRRLKNSTKNHVVRDVYVSSILRTVMANHVTRFQNKHIFLNANNEHLQDTDDFNAAWTIALKSARVHYRKPYTCRHTRAAMMLTGGVEAYYAANQLGHTVEMFLRTYSTWINALGDRAQEIKLEQLDKLR